jgi:hypothetical protein
MLLQWTQLGVLIVAAGTVSWGMYTLIQPLLKLLKTRMNTEQRHKERMKVLGRWKGISVKEGSFMKRLGERLNRELELLLKTTMPNYKETTVHNYILGNLILFFSSWMLCFFYSKSWWFSLFIACIAVFLIYTSYRIKLKKIQVQGGYDLAEAIGILSSKYKVTRGKMRLALRLASQEISSELIRNHFINIIREELNYTDLRQIESSVEEFIYSIRTTFAKQLGLTILKGLIRGENVENTLMNIDKNIHKNMDMLQDEGDSSSEVLQLSWLHVILFPLLMIFMVAFMGWNSTMHYQFETENGRDWFTITILFIIGSLVMGIWFRKPANDY